MDKSAEYWQRTLAAYEYARQATNEKSRAAWLQIAESFAALFRLTQRVDEAIEGIADPNSEDQGTRFH
jgi:hypothetical protein